MLQCRILHFKKLDLTATCHTFEHDGASLWVHHGWTRVQRQHLLLEQITQSSQADTVYWGHFRVFSKIRDSLHWPATDYTSPGTLSSVLLLMSMLSAECPVIPSPSSKSSPFKSKSISSRNRTRVRLESKSRTRVLQLWFLLHSWLFLIPWYSMCCALRRNGKARTQPSFFIICT